MHVGRLGVLSRCEGVCNVSLLMMLIISVYPQKSASCIADIGVLHPLSLRSTIL